MSGGARTRAPNARLLVRLTLSVAALLSVPVLAPAAQLIGASGSCADIQGGNPADGTPMILFHCHGSPNQSWVISNGTVSGAGGVCLDVMGSAPAEGAQVIVVQCNGRPSQKWQLTGGQIVGIGGKCLDVQGGGADDRTPLVLKTCSAGSPSQQWSVQ